MHIASSKYPLILAVAALGAFLFPEWKDTRAAQDRATIRILAYNIKHGEGMDGVIDLERAARVIRELEPDIVALQEIDSAVERTSRVDQATRLGELTSMHSVFGAFFDYQGGRYGMALLSKFPITAYANHWLPEGTEPRTGLAAQIQLGDSGQEIIVVGIHLYRTPEQRYAQASGLVDIYRNETTPVILAGDFNSLPDSDVLALLKQHWHVPAKGEDRLTYPSDVPQREIDYIMYRPADRFEVVEHKVFHEPLVSDHRPVIIELRFLNPANRN
ncbi:MAG: endonuclease/exonuclease/phosphatase family protein [Gemmatimonadota bacterium]|nr:MAG: endonuclease/exonuclease/phosphatase family protein [Gemmatimonadota bacterium]